VANVANVATWRCLPSQINAITIILFYLSVSRISRISSSSRISSLTKRRLDCRAFCHRFMLVIKYPRISMETGKCLSKMFEQICCRKLTKYFVN